MIRITTAAAVIALAYGVQSFVAYSRLQRRRGEQRQALQTWEGEGGAVPVAPNRTAAQVLPHPDPGGVADAASG